MLKRSKSDKIYIGIDGGHKIGFSVWDKRNKQFLKIETTTFWEAIEWIDYWKNWAEMNAKDLAIVVEDVSQNKPVFKLAGVYKNTPGSHMSKLGSAGKVAESVGRVKENSDLLISYAEKKCSEVIKLRPGKRSMTKMKSDKFKQITGWTKRTSEHARDSAMMIWQM